MQIAPPNLSGASTSNGSKKFDRQEFYPSSLSDGQTESFRLLGTYDSGHCAVYYRWATEQLKDGELRFNGYAYAEAWPGEEPPHAARQVDFSDPSRPKLEETVKAKKALVWIAYSLERKRPELLILESRALRESIAGVMEDAEFSFTDEGIASYLLKFSRKGTGLNTSYSVYPLPKKTSKAESEARAAIEGNAQVSKLLIGEHPFIEPRSQFSTPESLKAASASPAVTGVEEDECF